MTSVREASWLLRCTGFGAVPSEVQRVRRLGYRAWLDEALSRPPAPLEMPWTTRFPPGQTLTFVQLAGLITWWLERMTRPREGLREKMTLFWHGLFTSSADPVFSAGLLLCQNQVLRENALGSFEDLLQQVSRDPAMLVYLDGFRNKKDHPNENYAREVMELFTVGPGQYSEADLREAARAFTGWELAWMRGAEFRDNPAGHDTGPKRFKGMLGELSGRDVLHRLARDPACARHITARLWSHLVGTRVPPEEGQRLADVFTASHGNISVVLRSLLLGGAFRAAAQPRQSVQTPVEYVVNFCRLVDRPFASFARDGWDARQLKPLQRMGQLPFLPPSVAGWREGQAWLDTSTLYERLTWMQGALRTHQDLLRRRCSDLLQACDPRRAVQRLLWLTHQLDAGPPLREMLLDSFRGVRSAPSLLSLILLSPEVHLR